MNKKIRLYLLAMVVCGFSMNSIAATLSTTVSAKLEPDQWWSVIAYGKPTSYANVGAHGGASAVTKSSIALADDSFGKYRITEIKFMIGSLSDVNNDALYRTCSLQDLTHSPVNEINANVSVYIQPDNTCTATISAS